MLVSRAGASSQQLAACLRGQLSGGCHSSPQSAELVLLLVSEPMHRLMLKVEKARNIVISGVAEQASLKLDWTWLQDLKQALVSAIGFLQFGTA